MLEFEEPRDVPLADIAGARIDVDGEVEVVADGQAHGSVLTGTGGLEDVEAFDDEDIGGAHNHLGAGNDVVRVVRVHGRADLGGSGFHGGDELEQLASVVGFGESLPPVEAATVEFGIGVEEPVGGDEFDAWSVGPAGEQLAQHTRRRRLAHGHRSGDADDEWCALGVLRFQPTIVEGREELPGQVVFLSPCGDVEVEQS